MKNTIIVALDGTNGHYIKSEYQDTRTLNVSLYSNFSEQDLFNHLNLQEQNISSRSTMNQYVHIPYSNMSVDLSTVNFNQLGRYEIIIIIESQFSDNKYLYSFIINIVDNEYRTGSKTTKSMKNHLNAIIIALIAVILVIAGIAIYNSKQVNQDANIQSNASSISQLQSNLNDLKDAQSEYKVNSDVNALDQKLADIQTGIDNQNQSLNNIKYKLFNDPNADTGMDELKLQMNIWFMQINNTLQKILNKL